MTASLREIDWPRFLNAPDGRLVARLYEPGLRRAVKYERCCAYFSSSVLSAAAAGFGVFIERILAGQITQKPALYLLVNEELSEPDVEALLQRGQDTPLIERLIERFGTPANALQKRRLEMLAWLARDSWLEVGSCGWAAAFYTPNSACSPTQLATAWFSREATTRALTVFGAIMRS
jgi:hypothetical protein